MIRIPVKFDDLVSEMELQIDDTYTYINTKTGEVITLSREELGAAEDETPLENFPDWQRENIEKAIEVFDDVEGIFVPFTLRNHFDEYEIIEHFIESISNKEIREVLFESIQGSGAFRSFKDRIVEFSIEKHWYEFKEAEIKELVIGWCNSKGIEFTE